MKLLGYLILLGLVQACDPYGFGFKKNPAYVLNEAFKSVLALDHESFIDISGKEALCLYGNSEGMAYLRTHLNQDSENVEIRSKLIRNSSIYTNAPHFVGYWSYYNEKYQVDIINKALNSEILRVVVECHFGFEGQKSDGYQNLKLKKYKMKECRLIKLIPAQFEGLPLRPECKQLAVALQPLEALVI